MEKKVIFRNHENKVQNAVTASKSGTFQLVLDGSERVQTKKKNKIKFLKKIWDEHGEGRTSSHGLWFRIVQNVLCLWSDVSHGHGHLLDLCPLSEIASLLTETETCDG